MNDESIIELIRAGKTGIALNTLYKHFPLIRKMIYSKGGNSQDAEDIFQEALIILVKRIKNTDFKLTAQLSSYLFSVCRFLWKDELKKRKQNISSVFEPGLDELEEQDLTEVVEQENRAKLAEKVLDELKERCRELLLLFYEGRLKLKEIAVRMGYSSENTAKNQKYKCMENAKNRLRELQRTSDNF